MKRPASKSQAAPNMADRCDVAIIGMACTYPGARNLNEFWRNITGGVNCIIDVPPERWNPDVFHDPNGNFEDRVYTRKGGFLGTSFAFNPLKYGTMPRAVEGAEPDQFLVLRTVHEAMEDAGYLHRDIPGERSAFVLGRGNYIGAGVGGLLQRGMMTEQTLHIIRMMHPEFTDDQMAALKKCIRSQLPGFAAESAPGLIPNITTGRVANRLDMMGPTFTIDAACASSLLATDIAVRDLASGRFDLMLAGGCHICCEVPFLQVFAAMGALSRDSTIRPFDKHADGTLAGEGVGIIVLKRLSDARRDGDRVYAVIKGVGASSDGKAKGVTAPRLEGEELALRRAYDMCGFSPDTVGLIEAHGTGTPVGDPTEVEALRKVFGSRKGGPRTCALGSVKSMIGHTMPAAGVAGIIKTALSLYHRVLPPSLNCTQPLPELQNDDCPLYVNTQLRPWIHGGEESPRRAGVNAFGFGGVNAHVVLEDFVEGPARPTLMREFDSELIVLEADSRSALRGEVERIRNYLQSLHGSGTPELRDIASTLAHSRNGRSHVLGVVAASKDDLAAKLTRAATLLSDEKTAQIKDPKGIYYFGEASSKGGRLAFLFPGEGAQYLNMLGDLCIHFPPVRSFFDSADRAVGGTGRYPLSADVFPPPLMSEEETKLAEERLWQIERATEAVLTADGAMYTLLQQLGIKPDMITGHSAGEWVAMAASGILDFDEFVASAPRLSAVYGGLSGNREIPRAAMLAVGAGREEVIKLVAQIERTVHIANDNCPHQVVIVVELADAGPVMKHLQARGIFVERLPYDRGYHTPVFTYICEPLHDYFSSLKISSPKSLLYSSTTARPYPKKPKDILQLVSETFARPLLFRDTIEAMYNDGARIFLEVGPRGLLTGFVDDILRGRPHTSIAMNKQKKSGVTTLHHCLAMLAALQVPMDLKPLYERRSPRKLQWDAKADRLVDPDKEPGTMQIPLSYPQLTLADPEKWRALTHQSTPVDEFAPRIVPEASQHVSGVIDPTIRDVDRTIDARLAQPPPLAGETRGAHLPEAASLLQAHTQLMADFLQTHEQIMQAYMGGAVASPPTTQHIGRVIDPTIPTPEQSAIVGHANDQFAQQTVSAREVRPVSSTPVVAENIQKAEAVATAESIETILVRIVSDKTGYPPEMLDLDLDMEADLGIDSIKRIEVLGALQQMDSAVPADGNIDMEAVAKLKTLRQIANFINAKENSETPKLPRAQTDRPKATDRSTAGLTFPGIVARITPGKEVVVTRSVTLDEDLYLLDHCFDPPASQWDLKRDRLHVIPMTVSLEMMAEVASLLMPGLRVIGAKNMHASKWIEVHRSEGAVPLTISASRVENTDEVRVWIRRQEAAEIGKPSPALAESTIAFAAEYPAMPLIPPWRPANPRTPWCDATTLYAERRMFHGPRFQGVVEFSSIGEDGLIAGLQVLPRNHLIAGDSQPRFWIDPVLLDAAGQMVGYWPTEHLEEGFMMFPIQIQEIIVYGEPPPPGRRAECHVKIRDIGQRQVRADFDVIGDDGKLWMRVNGWTDWRFYWDRSFYDFWRFPNLGTVCERVELTLPEGSGDIEFRRIAPMGEVGTSIWENLGAHLILSQGELREYKSMKDGPRRTEWIFGRAAAKDAIRSWVKRHHGLDLFPADVEIVSDERGRPHATGAWTTQIAGVPRVSIAHKGAYAVAAAGNGLLGVDLEHVATRDEAFHSVAFDDHERRLLERLKGEHRDEWVTRAWCAKEAAGKAMGVGLIDGPATMVVRELDQDAGAMLVACGTTATVASGKSNRGRFVVHSIRDGDYIVAIAVQERNGHAG